MADEAATVNEAKVSIDGVEYALSDLSEEVKAQIQSLRFVEAELARLQAQAAVMNTAKVAYANALKALLAKHRAAKHSRPMR